MLLAACSHTLGEIPLADGNILVIEGYGTKSSVQLSCLDADAVEQLISTKIPRDIAPQSCYQVAVATSDSSDISKAVSSFVSADNEFGKMIATGRGRVIQVRTRASTPAEEVALGIVLRAATVNDDVFAAELAASRKNVAEPDQALPILEMAVQHTKSEAIRFRLEKAIAAFRAR